MEEEQGEEVDGTEDEADQFGIDGGAGEMASFMLPTQKMNYIYIVTIASLIQTMSL